MFVDNGKNGGPAEASGNVDVEGANYDGDLPLMKSERARVVKSDNKMCENNKRYRASISVDALTSCTTMAGEAGGIASQRVSGSVTDNEDGRDNAGMGRRGREKRLTWHGVTAAMLPRQYSVVNKSGVPRR
jgi:hypothetical protein